MFACTYESVYLVLNCAAPLGLILFCLCVPRVSYRALPSFHPGLCRSIALAGLIVGLFVVFPGFHIGLCPHFTLGYAGVSCLRHSELASILMRLPCTNVRVSVYEIVIAFPILKTSAKSVQTTAEVCADYTCSLYRLQLKSPESTTYLQI